MHEEHGATSWDHTRHKDSSSAFAVPPNPINWRGKERPISQRLGLFNGASAESSSTALVGSSLQMVVHPLVPATRRRLSPKPTCDCHGCSSGKCRQLVSSAAAELCLDNAI